jgi:predicted MFS family arabinose efflux permease
VSTISATRVAEAKRGSFVSFILLGHLVLCSVAWVPEYIDRLGVGFTEWGTILGVAPLGAISSILLAPRLLLRFGVRRTMLAGIALASVMLALLGFIIDPVWWAIANLGFNFFASLTGVAINTHAVTVQRQVHKPIISGLHAGWSLGAVLAAITGGLGTVFISLGAYLVGTGIITTLAMVILTRAILGPEEDGHRVERTSHASRKFYQYPLTLWIIALGFFAAIFPEIAVLEWSAVFARDSLGADAAIRSVPFAAFMGGMIIGRLSIGKLAERASVHQLSARGSVLTAVALAATVIIGPVIAQVSTTGAIVFLAGLWAVAGFGIAPLGPTLMASAAQVPGVSSAHAISLVSFVPQVLSIGAKILMGALAQGVSVAVAFAFPIALLLFGAWIVSKQEPPRPVKDIDSFQPPTGPIPIVSQPE